MECGFIDEDYESEGTTFSRYHGIDIEGLLSPENHVVWIDTNSPEIAEGTSRTNKGEVDAIEWVLSQLAESESFARYNSKFNNEEDKEIGLITFYGAQLKQLRRLQANYSGKLTLKPSSVDRFQGMERNIVIVSLVRSNCIAENEKQAPDFRVYKELGYRKQKDFGFAKSPNRLNVALSRAKRLLIIVGNSAHYSAYKNKDGEAIYKNVFDSIKNNPNGRVIRWEHKLMKKRPRPISKNRSANLNTRDINPATDGHLRVIETWLRPCADRNNPKIAVLELSTKAVKCLIGKDQDVIRSAKVDEFNFQNFIRNANKTETGKGLNSQNEMDMRYFEMNVLPTIRNWKRVMQAENVDIVYTVATAAYRTARNRDEIVSFIKDKTGINVRILSKKEESVSTMFAYLFSSRYKQEMLTSEHVIMIDQGGGSTEVSVFRQNDPVNSYSINLGTTALRNILFLDSDRNTPVEEALSRSDQKIKERLVTFYKNMGEAMTSETESFCISVGTAITHATGGKNNAAQHDRVMTREKIEDCINTCTEAILSQFDTVGDLNDFDFEASKGNKKLDDQITMRLGLPMFLSLMDKFNIKEIHVSGTGLWYGIYLQYLHNISDK
ncbi:AAA domain-containing protein [Phocaeicola vulgatus]|nr:AAA domain-containing protein [Phocaeicola vulgatus]